MATKATNEQIAAWQIATGKLADLDAQIANLEKQKAQLDTQIEEATAIRDHYTVKYAGVVEVEQDPKTGDWTVKE